MPSTDRVKPVSAATSSTPSPVDERDHVLGSDEPRVTLIEYGDFGCPHCFASWRPVESLLQRFETLRLVWRHFPDPDLHPGSDLAAELSELAAASRKFWQAHSLLLAGRERFSLEGLIAVGERLEIDRGLVQSALEDHSFREPVAKDVADARRAAVHGTPTFFIDGERLAGHWRQLAQAIPSAVEKA
ncbi:MAG: DsbA family protein [Solirubrobacterales bacterium]